MAPKKEYVRMFVCVWMFMVGKWHFNRDQKIWIKWHKGKQ